MEANESPLFLACQEFVKESLSYLRRYIEDIDRLPLTTKIRFDEDGGYSSVPYPYLSLLVQKHMDQLIKLPQFKLCKDLMNADPNVKAHMNKNIGTHFIGLMRDSWHYLSFMLYSVLDIYYETGRFRKSLFKNAFDRFEQFISSESFKVLIVAPLVNFESEDINSIQIDKKIRIRKFTNIDKANLIEETGSLGISSMNVFQFKYVIEYETVADKSIQGESGTGLVDVRNVLDEIITTMRLFKRGNISYNILWSKSVLDFPGIAGGIQENILGRYNYAPPQYSLSKKEARNLAVLRKRLQKNSYLRSSPLDKVIRRLGYAYDRIMIEDKLIDYIFGLETFLSKEDDPIDSLSYKLSLRFSHLVGKNYDEREYYIKEMKRIYNIRSKIAHGDKKSKKQMESLDIYTILKSI